MAGAKALPGARAARQPGIRFPKKPAQADVTVPDFFTDGCSFKISQLARLTTWHTAVHAGLGGSVPRQAVGSACKQTVRSKIWGNIQRILSGFGPSAEGSAELFH